MGLNYRWLAILIFVSCTQAFAQVTVSLSVKPPFTPFISDYTNPSRLQDISVSLFNQSGKKLRLKFKISLKNAAKGIDITIKESVNPINPLELEANEFKFVVLDDVSKLYGKLDQNSFNISGADIQNLILDGTIPDGIYEVCIQAFDFDAPGFTVPLSGNSPSGCFTFQVNYTDPPTDIRFNGQLLNYAFGGNIPKIGVNTSMGQNYNIQFTPPSLVIGGSYQYELLVFENTSVNPKQQQEKSIIDGISTIQPIIRKQSSVPFFTIDPGDIELDISKDYFLLIRVEDLNRKALFKNKGYSTFKAFHLINTSPVFVNAIEFQKPTSDQLIRFMFDIRTIKWTNGVDFIVQNEIRKNIETKVKIIRLHKTAPVPTNVFTTTVGEVLLESKFRYDTDTFSAFGLLSELNVEKKFGTIEDNNDLQWVIGVQHSLIPGREFTSHITLANNGYAQTSCQFFSGSGAVLPGAFSVYQKYPLDNDTLPFQYPPVVFGIDNVKSSDKLVFTQFNSPLEPIESFKHMKLTLDAGVNSDLNAVGLDTVVNEISTRMGKAADDQLKGRFLVANSEISEAKSLIRRSSTNFRVQVIHALNATTLPLGNSSVGKSALMKNVLRYQAAAELMDVEPQIDFPNLAQLIYVQPFKNNINWTAKLGIYNQQNFGAISVGAYSNYFHKNELPQGANADALRSSIKTGAGTFNTGMMTPQLQGIQVLGKNDSGATVLFSFLPSPMPLKILPERNDNDVWREFKTLNVAQQWNLELSRDRNFKFLDTVFSKRIIKDYEIAQGAAPIIADLYSKVSMPVFFSDTGKYYWRVTWSNVTVEADASNEKKQYFRNLANQLATAQLLNQGQDISPDDVFFIRKNYRFSKTDSFSINASTKATKTELPAFELLYPLNSDTIPFYYPPVVIKKNPKDTSYKFVLSRFNSDLEPYYNHNYILLDPNHTSSAQLRRLSYDSTQTSFNRSFDALAREQLYSGEDAGGNPDQLAKDFLLQSQKKIHLAFYSSNNSQLLPLGNSSTGKINLINSVINRQSAYQLAGVDESDMGKPSLSNMIYKVPYKSVNWSARLAYYYPYGHPNTSVDSFERNFVNRTLGYLSPISPENKAGLAFLNGNFSVGMKTPILTSRFNGRQVAANQISIKFKPSEMPIKPFPDAEQGEIWDQWKDLFTAQQWNIEVSNTPKFDSIIYVYSKCLIEKYDILGGKAQLMNDFYNERTQKIDLKPGKYFYRITWSNPSQIDTNNALHMGYFKHQINLISDQSKIGSNADTDAELNEFIIRKNYKFSAIDSLTVIDSVAVNDSAVCGLNCAFSMNGVNTTTVVGHININDIIKVGQFDLKITSISSNATNRTYSGTGSIKTKLFGAPIAVKFSDIGINAEKRMVSGVVKAQYKTNQVFGNFNADTGTLMFKVQEIIKSGNQRVSGAIGNVVSNGEVEQVYDYLSSPANMMTDAFSGEDIKMPFGLSREIDNYPHTIAITDITLTPTEAKFNAAAILQLDLPNITQYLGFSASGLCLTPGGIGNVANGGALDLVGTVNIPLGEQFGQLKILGKTSDTSTVSGTRVVWDCKGFKQLDVKVSVELPGSLALPVANGKLLKSEKVVATGLASFSSINKWLLALDFNKDFELKCLPGFTLTGRQLTLDFTDALNPQGMVFPSDYLGDRSNVWQGLYIKDIGVKLPNFFSEHDTTQGIRFNAQNLILDRTGFTGTFAISNLIDLNSGKMAGWKYSIDQLNGNIIQNSLTSLSINGQLGVPVLNGNIHYGLMLNVKPMSTIEQTRDSVKVSFTLQPTSNISMPALFAGITLLPSSKVEVIGQLFSPKTLRLQSNLNGTFNFSADNIAGFKDVRFGSLPFEGLKVRTAFYTLDSFSFKLDRLGGINMNRVVQNSTELSGTAAPAPVQSSGEDKKVGGFPIDLSDFAFDNFTGKCLFDLDQNPGLRIGLKFKLTVNIADAGGNAIGGQSVVGLYMGLSKTSGLFGVAPKGINLDTIRIYASLNGAVTIAGGLAFIANDALYGNGIAGFVLAKTPVISVGVTGMFGEVSGMRYWMFGAKAEFPPIPIDFSANVIYANSFSGEFWYKMNRTPGTAADQAAGFQIGKSPSGASFVPDANQLFGFGAALGLTGPPGSPLFGDVGLYAQINSSGGLSKLTIEGNLWMTNNDKATAPILINGNVTIDVDNKKLVGLMSALVNVGGGAVRGRVESVIAGRTYYTAGSVDFLIDFNRNVWHIKLGDPFKTNNKLGFGFYAGTNLIFNAGGYFMMGNQLPQQLPPMEPSLVTKLQQSGIVVPGNRQSAGTTGFVILAGLDANIPEKKIEFGTFYAGLSLQFAVDGMMKQQSFNCPGRNGLQGYYITGKAYAVVNGALGIHVDLPFYQGDIIAAELNAAMMVDAGIMNPYYFKGQFAANYSVLGGLIEGSKTFNFELAEDPSCKPKINTNNFSFGTIVADVKPVKDATDVIVGVEPTIALNFAVNKETVFPVTKVVNGANITVNEKIRVKYEYIRLIEEVTNRNKKLSIIVSSDGLDITVRPDSFLKDNNTYYTLSARFFVEKFNSSNNTWSIVKRKNNSNWDTIISIRFRTELDASFQDDYVLYSVPRAGERYFKVNDYTTAKIVCKQTNVQSTFFTGTLAASGSFRQAQLMSGYNVYYGLYTRAGNPGDTVRVPLTFINNEIRFPLPTKLDTLGLYQFRIIKERIPGTTITNNSQLQSYQLRGDVSIRTRTAETKVDRRLIMHAFIYKVSQYKTMREKISQVALRTPTYSFSTTESIKVEAVTNEPFEEFELKAFSYPASAPMVTLSPTMVTSCSNNAIDDNNWIITDYRPRVYKAGDSLQRKRTSFTSAFYDRTKQLTGARFIFDEHIMPPITQSSLLFNYDLRLADQQIFNLNTQLIQVNNLMVSGITANSTLLSGSSNISIDPVTGSVSSGLSAPTTSLSTSSTNSTTTVTPAIGSRLNIDYNHFLLMHQDFSRLKTLANNIMVTNPSFWMLDFTSAERALVTRVNRTDYKFRIPTNSNKFAIALHPNNNNTAPVKKLLINSNIIEQTTALILQTSTSFSTFLK